MHASPRIIERSRQDIDQDSTEAVLTSFWLAGRVTIVAQGTTAVASAGQLMIMPMNRPFLAVFDDATRAVGAIMPRRLFTKTTGLDGTETLIHEGMSANPFVETFTRTVIDAVAAGASTGRVDDLIVTAIEGMVVPSAPGLKGHLSAASRYLAVNAADPRLSARTIAGAIGISERQLSRVLAEAGESLPRMLRNHRLRHSLALIRAADPDESVATIARRSGFGSPGHFATVFTREFGLPPKEVLHRARLGRPLGITPRSDGPTAAGRRPS